MPNTALARLKSPDNENLDWLLGDLLRARAQRTDWYRCIPLQQLERGQRQGQAAWNQLIRTTRGLLAEPDEAQQRARELLNPEATDFDQKLDDFVAELVAINQLAETGVRDFHFCAAGDSRMPDLRAARGEASVFAEVKNLREPDSITLVAFRRWHANRAQLPQVFTFDVALDYEGEPNLTAEQKLSLEAVVDRLPTEPRPKTVTRTLPGGLQIRFDLRDGAGVMYSHGAGVLINDAYIGSGARRLLLKCLEQVRKALTQLYSDAVPEEAIKIVFLRWKVPDDLLGGMEEIDDVRNFVKDGLRTLLGQFFPNIEIHIRHNWEQ